MIETNTIEIETYYWQTLLEIINMPFGMQTAQERLQHQLHIFAEQFGFKRAGVLVLQKQHSNDWIPSQFSFNIREFNDAYMSEGIYKIDPYINRMQTTQMPINWGISNYWQQQHHIITPELKRFYHFYDHFYDRFESHHGICVPIHGPNFHAVLSLTDAGCETDFLKRYDQMAHLSHIFTICLTEQLFQHNFIQPFKQQQLTRRETECLTWVCQGKTMSEIACILTIAETTVIFHIENAKRKLEAVTLAQLVAKALVQKQIRI